MRRRVSVSSFSSSLARLFHPHLDVKVIPRPHIVQQFLHAIGSHDTSRAEPLLHHSLQFWQAPSKFSAEEKTYFKHELLEATRMRSQYIEKNKIEVLHVHETLDAKIVVECRNTSTFRHEVPQFGIKAGSDLVSHSVMIFTFDEGEEGGIVGVRCYDSFG